MKKVELVFIPTPAIGHLVSHVEFSKRLLDQDDRFSVTVVVINGAVFSPKIQTYAESLAASDARLRFISLPQIEVAQPSLPKRAEVLVVDYIEMLKPLVRQSIINHVLLDSVSVAGLVVDMFTAAMIDVANEVGLPSYLFNTSGAASLGFMLHLVTRHDQNDRAFQACDTESVIVPGYVNPVPSNVFPSLWFDNDGCICIINLVRRFKETKAIISNSFAELESHAVKSLLELYHNIPFYMMGPLLDLRGQSSSLCDNVQRDEIMKWLYHQPPSSVVFLCFGSLLPMDEAQIKEIAKGLEQSGHRFLWSVRVQIRPILNDAPSEIPTKCTNLKEILPQGFLERTKGRGMVCGWAPQIEVLAHKSIGGFVSHCGWNSILESLWYGVPIVSWPMYAEQQLNALLMVKDLGLAVELRLDFQLGESDLVMADEIEKAVNRLMEADSEVRKRVKRMSEASREAVVGSDGSSFTSYARLIEFMMGNAYSKS